MDDQSVIVLDTHVLVWWVDGERKKLSRSAVQALLQHGRRNELLVSSVSFFEITTLERCGRLRFNMPAAAWLAKASWLHVSPFGVRATMRERRSPGSEATTGLSSILIVSQ